MQHITDNHDALLDYLYEEGDPAERLKIAEHLQECAPCSIAVLEFQNVRGMLRDWKPPAAELGFRVVRDGDTSPGTSEHERARGRASWGWIPAMHQTRWAQAAAAVLLFAAGMAVSQVRMNYSGGALTVQVGPAESSPIAQTARAATDIFLPPQNLVPVSVTNDAPVVQGASASDTEQLLQRVRAMIDQSEQRQQRELALRISQMATEEHTQHQADLLRIQQNMGQQQDDFMNYLVRTSGGPK
jgi:anti-sigma factor RsiW